MILKIENLSFSYDSKTVFKNLNVTFSDGWTALIGANGSGKSTLLRLITGALIPDRGSIYTGGNIVVCPQMAEKPPPCFSDSDILNSREFYELVDKLAIGLDWTERWDTLSGGEKKRCLIADTLVRNPAVLLLDEPANHIDKEAAELLITSLKTFSGTGLVVSHNMAFLNSLAASTLLLVAEGDLPSCTFSFALPPLEALSVFEKEQEFKRELRTGLALEAKNLLREKKDAVREAEHRKRSTMSKRNLDPKDSDTRAKINLARLSGRDKRGGQKVALLQSRLAQKTTALGKTNALGQRKTGAGLNGTKSERPVLCFLEEGVIELGSCVIHHPLLEIRNDSRIILSGPNGSGKTTLLKHIRAAINKNSLNHYYLPQELGEDELQSALGKFQSLREKEKGAVLSVFYRLGSEPASLLTHHDISPGEARKLCFSLAMLEKVSLILLDEPTNHMDAVSAMSLADALSEYKGSALIITHDAVFAEKTGQTFWEIKPNGNRNSLEIRSLIKD